MQIKIKLDVRRKKKDGTYPLVFRINFKERYCDIPTGYSLTPKQFNEEKQTLVGNRDATRELQKLRDSYIGMLAEFMSKNATATIKDIRSYFTKKKEGVPTIEAFWKKEVQTMLNSNRSGSARVYQFSLDRLSQVMDFNRTFEKLSYSDLVNAETQLLSEDVKINSIGVYMRSLRAICNKAIKLEYVDHSWYPFNKYKIKKEATVPRPITMEKMKEFFALNLSVSHPLFKVWQLGQLIFMLRGINVKDLLILTNDNIKQGRIIYKRSKTKKIVSIKILPLVQKILDELQQGGETLVGVLDVDTDSVRKDMVSIERYGQIRKNINSHLHKLGDLIELEKPLTSYTFRYSYANLAKQLGFSKDMISEALSHSYGSAVTGIYLESFDLEELDRMNEAVCNAVLEGD